MCQQVSFCQTIRNNRSAKCESPLNIAQLCVFLNLISLNQLRFGFAFPVFFPVLARLFQQTTSAKTFGTTATKTEQQP
jgi:hypothetical protein